MDTDGTSAEKVLVITSKAPEFDDVVRQIEMPKMLPPVVPQRQIADEAADQTVTMRRIAQTLEFALDYARQRDGRRHFVGDVQFSYVQAATTWMKCMVAINLATVTLVVTYLMVR